jgi:large subunit ribosomal protein L21
MFAVIKTGGKQYRVQQGDVLRVEKLAADAGETVQFNEVLVVGDQIGAPLVAGAAVQAAVIDQIKGEKVIHFVRRRRKHSSKRTKGHRQQLTLLRVTEILSSGGEATGVKAAIGAGAKGTTANMAASTEPAQSGLGKAAVTIAATRSGESADQA